jgi:zinc transport system permease protein
VVPLLSAILPIGEQAFPAINAGFLRQSIDWFTSHFHHGSWFSMSFNIHAALALVLVGLNCGMVGSLVVGSRMAFFSDALAHCAFAGVSIGYVFFDVFLSSSRSPDEFWHWVTPIMVAFGILVGFGIAFVRQRTGLTSDTVIGVFFASAIGLAAMLRKLINSRRIFNLEDFLFGDPLLAEESDLIMLFFLTIVTGVVLWLIYNPLLLAGCNNSLALSRRVPVRAVHYVFVILLALIVNLCLRSVGVLLINALMVVPAATAINISRNLRQVFWLTIAITIGISLSGQALSWEISNRLRLNKELGIPGTIIMLGVILFTLSIVFGPRIRQWLGRPRFEKAK